jgi:hypothetical protein
MRSEMVVSSFPSLKSLIEAINLQLSIIDFAELLTLSPLSSFHMAIELRRAGWKEEELGTEEETDREAREVVMFVVGTGRNPGIERMVDYLSGQFDVPINVVSYEVFDIEGGYPILVRELTESEAKPPGRPTLTVPEICARADRVGIGKDFRTILGAAQRHGLYARPWKNAVMYTPPFNRNRTLLTANAWTLADGLLRLYVGSEAFAEFYPVTEETAVSTLGPQGWRLMTSSDVEEFVASLARLFESIEEAEQDTQS